MRYLAQFHKQTAVLQKDFSYKPLLEEMKKRVSVQSNYLEMNRTKIEKEVYISPFGFVFLEDTALLNESLNRIKRLIAQLEKEWERKKEIRFVLSEHVRFYVLPAYVLHQKVKQNKLTSIKEQIIEYDEHFSLTKDERLLFSLYLLNVYPFLTLLFQYGQKNKKTEFQMIEVWEKEKKRYHDYKHIAKHFSSPFNSDTI